MQTQKKQKEIVDFVKERDFGELIGAPFYFIIQEFKPFARSLLRYAGPYVAIAILGMSLFSNHLYKSIDLNADLEPSTVLYLLIFGIFLMIGFLAAVVTTHSYISLYVREGKDNFTMDDVGRLFKQKVFKVFFAGMLVYLIVFVGILLFYIPGIYFAIALSFFSIVIVYENATIGESISRSFQVVKGYWWLTLGVILVFGMIIGFMSYVFIIPIYAIIIVAAIGGSSISGGSVIFIVVFVGLYFVAYLFLISLQQVLVGFLYFNILTKKEEPSLFDRIDAINDDKENVEDTGIFKNVETKEEKDDEKKEEDRFSDNKEDNRFDDNRFKPKY